MSTVQLQLCHGEHQVDTVMQLVPILNSTVALVYLSPIRLFCCKCHTTCAVMHIAVYAGIDEVCLKGLSHATTATAQLVPSSSQERICVVSVIGQCFIYRI